MAKETRGFQTEAKQLLHLMIHSLYSNKEIFLRELISNASDAVDKLRFEALSDSSLFEDSPDLKVRISADSDAGTITIEDNGIGMSRDAEYSLEDIKKADRGTSITLYLKEEEVEFSADLRIRSTIKKYSDHIAVPIEIKTPSTAALDDEKDGNTDTKTSKTKEAKIEKVSVDDYQTINAATALWTRSKGEIKDEEYKEFYKYLSHDVLDPLVWSHNKVEGKFDYTSLLYIPSSAPFDLHNYEVARGLKLYRQPTFIMDDPSQFLPRYLRFVKGVLYLRKETIPRRY